MRVKSIIHHIRQRGIAVARPCIEVDIQEDGTVMTPDEVVKKVRTFTNCSRLVFSGMDPMVEQLELLDVVAKMQQGWEIVIETTGGIMPDYNIRDKITEWEVRVPTETTLLPFQWNADAIRVYAQFKNCTFEWDIKGEMDLIEVKKTVHFLQVPRKRIILALETDTYEEFDSRFEWLKEFCISKGSSIGNPIVRSKLNGGNKKNANNIGDPGLPDQAHAD